MRFGDTRLIVASDDSAPIPIPGIAQAMTLSLTVGHVQIIGAKTSSGIDERAGNYRMTLAFISLWPSDIPAHKTEYVPFDVVAGWLIRWPSHIASLGKRFLGIQIVSAAKDQGGFFSTPLRLILTIGWRLMTTLKSC